jgi:predicted nicotinamide N-methyase
MTFTIFLQPTEGAENTDKIKIHKKLALSDFHPLFPHFPWAKKPL